MTWQYFSWTALAATSLCAVFLPSLCSAHPLLQGVGTQAFFSFAPESITLQFNVGFSPMTGFLNMVKADVDRDGRVSGHEAEAFADAVFEAVLPQIQVSLDGEVLPLRARSRRIEGLIGSIGQLAFDLFYDLEASVPVPVDRDVRVLRFQDGTFPDELSNQISWFPLGEGRTVAFLVVEPQGELVVDAIRVTGRRAKVLLATDRELLGRWASEHGFAAAGTPSSGSGGKSAFADLTRNDLPACEVRLGQKEVLLKVAALAAPHPDRWDMTCEQDGKSLRAQYLGPTEVKLPALRNPVPLFIFRLLPEEATFVTLRLAIRNPPLRTWRFAIGAQDPTIRWSVIADSMEQARGFLTASGPGVAITWRCLSEIARKEKAPPSPTGSALPESSLKAKDPLLQRLTKLSEGVRKGQVGVVTFVTLCLFAFLYGAAHAFAPGHGKSLVAAYLAGRSGRIRDAVILGLTVTFTHLVSVYVLALAGLLLFSGQSAYRQHVVVAMQLLSSVLLVLLGATLTYRALRKKLPHHHHDHAHGAQHHEHVHAPQRHVGQEGTENDGAPVSLRQLLAVGLTGGMVPCPAGLLVVFASWYMGIFWAALVLLFFLSLGLGGTLIGLGISVVAARTALASLPQRSKRGALRRSAERLLPVLPAISGMAVVGLGVALFTLTVVKQGPLVGALLRSVRSALGGGQPPHSGW